MVEKATQTETYISGEDKQKHNCFHIQGMLSYSKDSGGQKSMGDATFLYPTFCIPYILLKGQTINTSDCFNFFKPKTC